MEEIILNCNICFASLQNDNFVSISRRLDIVIQSNHTISTRMENSILYKDEKEEKSSNKLGIKEEYSEIS